MAAHNNRDGATRLAGHVARAWKAFAAYVIDVARRRSLIGEILALQLVFAAFVGALALAGLWWASNAVLDENARKWGEQWLTSLDELGTPLYVAQDDKAYQDIESYVKQNGEIFFVRYYSDAGEPIYWEYPRGDPGIAPLAPETLAAMAGRPTDQQRYSVETLFEKIPIVRISKPIWTRSLLADGMLGVDLNAPAVKETLVGYIEVGADYSDYESQLDRAIATAMLIGASVLILLTAASWFIYRRALLPLSDLQQPLKMLAGGSTNFSVTTSGHREIVAIADALNTTVAALKERDTKLRQLANHDSLTGLINRHRFSELLDAEIEAAVDEKRTSALLFIDLDQFKYMNDSFGHAAGDRLLRLVAERLVASVRERDIVARFGGDEFIVLLMDVSKKEAESICTTLVKRMQDERFIEGTESFDVRCSIGVTMIRGARLTAEELLAQADMACHHAKAKGRNQFCVYKASDKEMNEIAQAVRASPTAMSKYLSVLQDLRLVSRSVPVDASPTVRTGHWHLRDPFFRFWFRFVFPYQDELVAGGAVAASVLYLLAEWRGRLPERANLVPPARVAPAPHRTKTEPEIVEAEVITTPFDTLRPSKVAGPVPDWMAGAA